MGYHECGTCKTIVDYDGLCYDCNDCVEAVCYDCKNIHQCDPEKVEDVRHNRELQKIWTKQRNKAIEIIKPLAKKIDEQKTLISTKEKEIAELKLLIENQLTNIENINKKYRVNIKVEEFI